MNEFHGNFAERFRQSKLSRRSMIRAGSIGLMGLGMADDSLERARQKIPAEVQAALDKIQGERRVPREILEKNIQLIEQLGEGKFGCVYKALLDESAVTA